MVHGQRNPFDAEKVKNIRPSEKDNTLEKEGTLLCRRKPSRVDNEMVKVDNVHVLLKYRSDCNLTVPLVWKSR